MPRAWARDATSGAEGCRSPASILRSVISAQPAFSASAFWVSLSALRRCLSQLPNARSFVIPGASLSCRCSEIFYHNCIAFVSVEILKKRWLCLRGNDATINGQATLIETLRRHGGVFLFAKV